MSRRLSKQECCLLDMGGRAGVGERTIPDFRAHGNGKTPYPCDPAAVNMIQAQGGVTSQSKQLADDWGTDRWRGWRCHVDVLGELAWCDSHWYSLDVQLGWHPAYRDYRRGIAAQGWAPGPNPLGDRHHVLEATP